jgi:hypothetical protein
MPLSIHICHCSNVCILQDYDTYVVSSGSQNDHSGYISPSKTSFIETPMTLPQHEADKSHLSFDDNPRCSICPLDKLKELPHMMQQMSDMSMSPSLKSRLQE